MGACYNSPLYSFSNFVTIERKKPKPQKTINISKFQFEIHPFSEDYIRENIDSQYNKDTDGTEQSFLVSEDGSMKVFQMEDELITKRDKISSCLQSALIGKICNESGISQKNVVIFVQPQGREEYKRILFIIIIQTLISLDLTCFDENRGGFGVYFDWPLFIKDKKSNYIQEMVKQIHKKNTLMDSSNLRND